MSSGLTSQEQMESALEHLNTQQELLDEGFNFLHHHHHQKQQQQVVAQQQEVFRGPHRSAY